MSRDMLLAALREASLASAYAGREGQDVGVVLQALIRALDAGDGKALAELAGHVEENALRPVRQS